MLKIPKMWRDLSIEKKLDLPVSYFGFCKKDIDRIRKIEDRKKRIIEAGKIQFDKFGEVHSFLIAWIAGYSSDSTVRQFFGKTKKFRELFISSPRQPRGISFSWSDIKRNVKIPNKITPELAEETGIHIGDGNLYKYKDKNGFFMYRCSISGDLDNEYLYHSVHISTLIKDLYNIEPTLIKRKEKNNVDTRYSSRAVAEFKNKILGLPFGKKKNIEIPKEIFENDEFSKRCLCGIFDTDFHITSNLSISGKIHSLRVANQIHKILLRNKIRHIFQVYLDYARFYINKKEARSIVFGWKMSNPKHLTKFQVFDKFRIYIPFTTTDERIDLLNNKISINKLIGFSNSRRNALAK